MTTRGCDTGTGRTHSDTDTDRDADDTGVRANGGTCKSWCASKPLAGSTGIPMWRSSDDCVWLWPVRSSTGAGAGMWWRAGGRPGTCGASLAREPEPGLTWGSGASGLCAGLVMRPDPRASPPPADWRQAPTLSTPASPSPSPEPRLIPGGWKEADGVTAGGGDGERSWRSAAVWRSSNSCCSRRECCSKASWR